MTGSLMHRPVHILGIGADGTAGLSPRAREALAQANRVAGGRRHLELWAGTAAETFAITNNLAELIARLQRRGPDERWAVLASGDPLFYGIGHALIAGLGRDQVVVEPAVSSLQLAFARAGIAWHDAAVASIHGRPLAQTLLSLLGQPKIGLFTQDGSSPAAVAEFFLARGLEDYVAWVAEALGSSSERVTRLLINELPGRRFAELNILLLLRDPERPHAGSHARGRVAGIPDHAFAQPASGPVLLTHADVRTVTLSRFHDLPEGSIWDIGAGLGGVSIELARAFPDREIVAVERAPEQAAFLRENRGRFAAYNVRVVEGEAPEALDGEAAPAAVFIGGSGGRLDAILERVINSFLAGGCLVANFVVLENLMRALDRLRAADWPVELSQVQLSQGEALAGLTTLVPQRPVWILRGTPRVRAAPSRAAIPG